MPGAATQVIRIKALLKHLRRSGKFRVDSPKGQGMKPLNLYEPRVCTAGGVLGEQSRLKTRISTASSATNMRSSA